MYSGERELDDPGRLRDEQERITLPTCDECHDDAVFPVTLAGLGTFCSAGCADVASLKHEATMTYHMKETA